MQFLATLREILVVCGIFMNLKKISFESQLFYSSCERGVKNRNISFLHPLHASHVASLIFGVNFFWLHIFSSFAQLPMKDAMKDF
jgi:hypothetical protein